MARGVTDPYNRDRRFVLGTFAMGHLANDWAFGSMLLIAPAVAASFDLGAPEVGLLLAVHSAAGALVYVPAGLITDRVTRRGPLLAMTFPWVALGYLAASFAGGYWVLVGLLALAVLGDAAWHPIATGDLVQRYPAQRAHVLGVHAMGGTIGAEVLGPIGVGLILTFTDWQNALRLSVIPAALMGIVFVFAIRRLGETKPSTPPDVRHERPSVLRAWSTKPALVFVTTIVLYNMAHVAILSMTPLFLQRDLSYSPLTAGVVIAVMLTLGSILQPRIGRLSDQTGRRSMILAASAIGAVCAGLAGILDPSWISVVALIGAAVVFTAVRSVVLAAAVEIAHAREATNLAMAFTLLDGVGALGALLAGLAGQSDLTHAFLLSSGLSAAALIACHWLRLDEPQPVLA
jgi:MFS family permease